jgi:putative colanic acid biosynthesis glycosyltransferase
MKIVIIHSANNGFFPRFYKSLYNAIIQSGFNAFLLQPKNGINKRTPLPSQILFGTRLNWFIHYRLYKLTGLQDIWSFFETISMLLKLNKIKPDIIHLHVVNECSINYPLLTFYTRHKKIPVVWTMHDCRAFTGRCAYFDEINCNKWITGCGNCPQNKLYSPTWIDNSAKQWKIRKKLFNKFYSLYIITPSRWLANYVKKSFLKNNPCDVIYNGIDINLFSQLQPDTWLDTYNLRGKKIILGVAGAWEKRKGFEYFIQLSKELPQDYKIVLVGNIPHKINNIINIPKTSNSNILASLYQHSTIFCNPTLADNFPTTNIEALASGTPVITFNTGGSPEAIDETCGIVVAKGDYDALKNAIIYMANNQNLYTKKNCINRSHLFSNKQYLQYVELYKKILRLI